MSQHQKIEVVYMDGVFDLFHAGHVTTLEYIRKRYPAAIIVIGVISDKDCESYKRTPIMKQEDRAKLLKSCRFVDVVLENAPLVVTQQFVKEQRIDLVLHSFFDDKDRQRQAAFFANVQDKFQEIPYSYGHSTTALIERVLKLHSKK